MPSATLLLQGFFFPLKVDVETVLDLVFPTLGKHSLKVNFNAYSVQNP